MVLLQTTPLILSLLSSLTPSCLSTLSLPASTSSISHTQLIRLAALSSTSLHLLLRGTRPYFPPPPLPPQPSAAYLALKAKLLAQEEQRQYAAMVHKSHGMDQAAERAEEEEDNIPVSLPFNILISVLCCGGAVFYMTRWWNNAGLRVLLSLGVGVLVGVAEVVVYSGYLRKVKEARGKERGKKERKEVMLAGKEEKNVRDGLVGGKGTEEKEEIWGRGVNGGMRRRVRENWDKEQKQGQEIVGREKKEKSK